MDRGFRKIFKSAQQHQIERNAEDQDGARLPPAQASTEEKVDYRRGEKDSHEPASPTEIEGVAGDEQSGLTNLARSDLREHGEAYHTLLAGLGRIDVSVGQVVAMGEPIAAANSPDTAGPTDASAPADIYSKGATGPVLYVELRRHGQPINPLPWLATSNGKVSG